MGMRDGTLFLQHNHSWGDWKADLVTNMIERVSGSPYIHTQIYLRGKVYEITYPAGLIVSEYPGRATQSRGIDAKGREWADLTLEPTEELSALLTDVVIDKMIDYFQAQEVFGVKYGLGKLVIFLLLGFTKPAWTWIYQKTGFEPFRNNIVWGEFCSALPDEMAKYAGIDMFPGESEQYTAPGDWILCRYYRKAS